MKKSYTFEIVESLFCNVTIDAESEDEAWEEIRREYYEEGSILVDEVLDTDISLRFVEEATV